MDEVAHVRGMPFAQLLATTPSCTLINVCLQIDLPVCSSLLLSIQMFLDVHRHNTQTSVSPILALLVLPNANFVPVSFQQAMGLQTMSPCSELDVVLSTVCSIFDAPYASLALYRYIGGDD